MPGGPEGVFAQADKRFVNTLEDYCRRPRGIENIVAQIDAEDAKAKGQQSI
jgi:hypothetical protein